MWQVLVLLILQSFIIHPGKCQQLSRDHAMFAEPASSRHTRSVSCEDIASCSSGLLESDAADVEKTCGKLRRAMQCFRVALDDCHRTHVVPEDTIRSLEQQMDQYDTMLSAQCDGYKVEARTSYAEVAVAVTCENIMACTPDVSQFQRDAYGKGDTQKACRSLKDALHCYRAALDDCGKSSNMPQSAIRSLEQKINTYDQMLSEQCESRQAEFPRRTTEVATAVKCKDVASCTPNVRQFQGSLLSKGDTERACRSINNAIQCFRAAMDDCRKNDKIPEDIIRRLEKQMDTYDHMLSGYCDDRDVDYEVTSSDGVPANCQSITVTRSTCGARILEFRGSREDIWMTCRIAETTRKCFSDYVDYCRQQPTVQEVTVQDLQQEIEAYDEKLAVYCHDEEARWHSDSDNQGYNGGGTVVGSVIAVVACLVHVAIFIA